ncbi:MAG TPA: pectinesterase family protein, partial [Chitinophagaceae bacterium]|nr:pectinesterase family protein [Chitinophagaceae bacterium]
RAFSKTVFIRCELPEQITPGGWDNWGNPENEKTVFYAEYKNTGKGAGINKRVSWSKQLNDKEASEYTVENIFETINAIPSSEADWFRKSAKSFEWPAGKK